MKLGEILQTTLDRINSVIDEKQKAVVLKAKTSLSEKGVKTWISGGNLKELEKLDADQAAKYTKMYTDIGISIAQHSLPFIAYIDGLAIGGGAELASWCDLRVLTPSGALSYKQAQLGLATGYGGCSRLVSLVGLSNAQSMLLTGAVLSADEAKTIGYANIVLQDESEESLHSYIEKFIRGTSAGNSLQKKMLNLAINEQTIDKEHELFKAAWKNTDHLNFLTNFKRKNSAH